jgi:hypothetical protein
MFHTKVVEKIKTHVLPLITFFPENLAVYEILWKHFVEPNLVKDYTHALCVLDK